MDRQLLAHQAPDMVDARDLRAPPLVERKSRLRRIMPRIDSRVLLMEHIE